MDEWLYGRFPVNWRLQGKVDAKTKLHWIFAMKDEEPFALAGV